MMMWMMILSNDDKNDMYNDGDKYDDHSDIHDDDNDVYDHYNDVFGWWQQLLWCWLWWAFTNALHDFTPEK